MSGRVWRQVSVRTALSKPGASWRVHRELGTMWCRQCGARLALTLPDGDDRFCSAACADEHVEILTYNWSCWA